MHVFAGLRFRRILVPFLALVFALSPLSAFAQSGGAATVQGVVSTNAGTPLSGATVVLDGPQHYSTTTSDTGAFAIGGVEPGVYRVTTSEAGYDNVTRDLTVVDGQTVNLSVTANASSFNSQIKTIGRTSTTSASGNATINTSAASVSIISAQTFKDQGQTQVMNILNQTPGVITTYSTFNGGTNGAFAGTPQEVQIRGAQPYETESLIDGHPVSVGTDGSFQPLYLNPYLLQSIEVVKGPGALGADINYAIGGSVNYRTLEPTLKPTESVDLGVDSYGGQFSNYRATGTVANGKFAYALDYALTGTPGPITSNTQWLGTSGNFINAYVNGQPACANAPSGSNCPYGAGPGPNPNVIANYTYYYPLAICCSQSPTQYFNRSELAKFRFSPSASTSLTLSYIGAQGLQSGEGQYAYQDDYNIFLPPAGYTGSLASGTVLPYAPRLFYPFWDQTTEGLVQAELRTSVTKNDTILARYYAGANNYDIYNFGINGTYTYSGQAYGGIYLGTSTTPTFFNGQTITVSQPGSGAEYLTQDWFRGLSAELDHTAGPNVYSFSFDRNNHQSYGSNNYGFAQSAYDGVTIPAGSGQTLTTFNARALLALSSNLGLAFSNYFTQYDTHYSPDGGLTFGDLVNSFYAPRLALTWRPGRDTSYRLSLGSSIAPPYISLVNTPSTPPQGNNLGSPTYYYQQLSNPSLRPETGFGYDIGADQRLPKSGIVISGDLYLTNLRDQYVTESFVTGTYTPTAGENAGITAPLYTQETINLAHSRYDGVELSIKRSPNVGLGFVVQGALIRAYPYDVPPSLYSTALGPLTTNLAIIPNVNFQGSGNGYNGFSFGRVPYATGYAEANYQAKRMRLALGVTYYGSNNSFGLPAYGVANASFRYDLTSRASIYITGSNIFNAYAQDTGNLNGGIPVPLVNGMLGATASGNVGPAVIRADLSYKFGG